MSGAKSELTTLFADVCDSTPIYEQFGDEQGRAIISGCVNMLREVVQERSGRFVKSNGDDIMCTFPDPQTAITAACEMQAKIEEVTDPAKLAIRVGFQHGIVIHEEGGDVRGDSVNVAARLADYAKAGQIVTSEESLLACPDYKLFRKLEERVRLKGKSEPVSICEILWKPDFSMTILASEVSPLKKGDLKLEVKLGEQTCFVSESKFKVSIGRDASCDIRVVSKRASRQHATIEFRRGAFVLTDISTNATYLRQGVAATRLHREQAPIIGAGQLSLGVSFDKEPTEIIELIPH